MDKQKQIFYFSNSPQPRTELEELLPDCRFIYNSKFDLSNSKDVSSIIIIDSSSKDLIHNFLISSTRKTSNFPIFVITEIEDSAFYRFCFRNKCSDIIIKNQYSSLLSEKIKRVFENYNEYSIKGSPLNQTVDKDELTSKEEKIFNLVSTAPMFRVLKPELLNLVWGTKNSYTNTLDVHLYNLRKKLKTYNMTIECTKNGYVCLREFKPHPKQTNPADGWNSYS